MTDDVIEDFLEAVPLPALLIDRSERIIAANRDGRTLLGQHIRNRHFAAILRQPQVIETVETCLREQEPQQTKHLDNDGAHDTTFRVECRFVRGVGARQNGAVLVSFTDITEIETAGQMRRDFVANVSHELRTPLTALLGFIETLRGPAREDAVARERFLSIMQDEATRMNRLVGDLLSLNRVESQERIRPRSSVDLTGQLHSTRNSLAPLAESRGTVVDLDLPQVPVEIIADEDQLRQVLTNLMENAIKYGRKDGHVTVRLNVVERDPAMRGPSVRIQIIDDGPGIDPVHLPRLTERFYRADTHRSRELGGTGLGLAIVKHIINRHRGRLRVESEPGKGSMFTVILPHSSGTAP